MNKIDAPGELKSDATRESGKVEYLEKLDDLRQKCGITAAMLRDGRAEQMVQQFNQSKTNILLDDLREAWRHAVRALNCCENAAMQDSFAGISEIVVKLSQQLEFMETNSNYADFILSGHHVVADADGERFVKNAP